MAVSKVQADFWRGAGAQIPTEIWDEIGTYVNRLAYHTLRMRLRYKPNPRDDHSRVWKYLFDREDWLSAACEAGLNPCIIGYNLYSLLHNKYREVYVHKKGSKAKAPYLVLVLGHDNDYGYWRQSQCMWTDEMRALFWSSLKPFKWKTDTDIVFANGIRLNVSDIKQESDYVNVSRPQQLVSRRVDGLHSAYLYWQDDDRGVQDIKPRDVFGIGKSRTKKNVSHIVGLNWKHYPSDIIRQHIFQTEGKIYETNRILDDKENKIVRFEWMEEYVTKTPHGRRKQRSRKQ